MRHPNPDFEKASVVTPDGPSGERYGSTGKNTVVLRIGQLLSRGESRQRAMVGRKITRSLYYHLSTDVSY